MLITQASILPESMEVLEEFCEDYPHMTYGKVREKYLPLLNMKEIDELLVSVAA
jgi:hypothetical protein